MKCFTSCFQSSNYKRIQKTRNKSASKVMIDENSEHSAGDKQEKEVRPLEVLIDLIAEPKDESEKQVNSGSRKKVTFNLNVQVQAYEEVTTKTNIESPEDSLVKNEDESKEEKEVEEEAFSDSITSSSGFITYQPNHGLNNFRSSNEECADKNLEDEECADKNLEGSELANDANDNGEGFYPEESSESLFSISLDSKKHAFVADLGDKEVNSPFKKSVHNVVLNHVEGLIQLKAIKTKSKPLPSLNQTGNENASMEKQFCNQPNSKENEVAVDASLSSWLLESEKTQILRNDVGSAACDSSDSIKSSSRAEDRPILGEIYVKEIKQSSNCSSPRGSQSRGRNETPKIGTIGSYWKYTGQATSGSTSDSSCRGPLITSNKCRDQGEVKCNSIPFQMRLDRAVESDITPAQPAHPPLTV